MRVLPALALAAAVLLSPAVTRAGEGLGQGPLPPTSAPAATLSREAPMATTDAAREALEGGGLLVLEAFTEAARAGAAEARPARPRTVNARGREDDHQAPPPAAGVGRKVRVTAYAYHLRGFTARGTRTKLGAVAVDPRVIPMGSKLYIPGYGWGRAVDTGGAIHGRKIDVWLPTMSQCMQWGVRDVTITVLP